MNPTRGSGFCLAVGEEEDEEARDARPVSCTHWSGDDPSGRPTCRASCTRSQALFAFAVSRPVREQGFCFPRTIGPTLEEWSARSQFGVSWLDQDRRSGAEVAPEAQPMPLANSSRQTELTTYFDAIGRIESILRLIRKSKTPIVPFLLILELAFFLYLLVQRLTEGQE